MDAPETLLKAEVEAAGLRFVIQHDDANDHIFRLISQNNRFYEADLLDSLASLLSAGDLVLDVGANIGNHSVFFAGVTKCKVIAFEPNPRAVALLRKNVEDNGLTDQVSIQACGLSDRIGRGDILEADSSGNLGAAKVLQEATGSIELKTLDSIELPGAPRLIKIDVEGMEIDVIRGAKTTLSSTLPALCLECSSSKQLFDIHNELSPLGYVCVGSFNYTPTHIFVSTRNKTYQKSTLDLLSRTFSNIALLRLAIDEGNKRVIGFLKSDASDVASKVSAEVAAVLENLQAERSDVVEIDASVQRDLLGALAGVKAELSKIASGADEATGVRSAIDEILRLLAAMGRMSEVTQVVEAARGDITGVKHDIQPLADALLNLSKSADVHAAELTEVGRRVQELGGLSPNVERLHQNLTPLSTDVAALKAGLQPLADAVASVSKSADQHAAGLTEVGRRIEEIGALASGVERLHQDLTPISDDLASLRTDVGPIGEGVMGLAALLAAQGAKLSSEGAEGVSGLTRALADLEGRLDPVIQDAGSSRQALTALDQLGVVLADLRREIAAEIERGGLLETRLAGLQTVAGGLAVDLTTAKTLLETRSATTETVLKDVQAAVKFVGSSLLPVPAIERSTNATEAAVGELAADVKKLKMALAAHVTDSRTTTRQVTGLVRGLLHRQRRAAVRSLLEERRDDDAAEPAREPTEPVSICVQAYNLASSWEGFTFHQAVRMDPKGLLVLKTDQSTPGVKSTPIETGVSGVFQVRVKLGYKQSSKSRPIIRVTAADTGETLGPDQDLDPGENVYRFYQPTRVSRLQILLLVRNPKVGFEVKLRSIRIDLVDPESHQSFVSRKVGQPVIASLASIPSRRPMLEDAIQCLLCQCDEVRVFLNGYPDVPEFLNHPRVTIRQSETWDDTGDAGKFGWVEEQDEPGFRIICDDDLLFPPDLVERLVAKVAETRNQAIVGLHGIILRQPIQRYYDAKDRFAVHFQSKLDTPKLVQVLATCVMCYHSSRLDMQRRDFMFRNMADIWLAKYALENRIPLLLIDRPFKWIRQNLQEGGFETIYENALKRTRTQFDSSMIQDAVVKQSYPLAIQKLDRDVLLMIVKATSEENLGEFLKEFHKSRDKDSDWVLIILNFGQDTLFQHVREMPFEHELHVVNVAEGEQESAGRALSALLPKLTYDLGFACSDGVRLKGRDWWAAPREDDWFASRDFVSLDLSETGLAPSKSYGVLGDFCVFRPGALNKLTPQVVLPSTTTRPPRLRERFSTIFGASTDRPDRPVEVVEAVSDDDALIVRSLSEGMTGVGVPSRISLYAPNVAVGRPPATINEAFERVVVINLDRRPDRWEAASAQLAAAGVAADRFQAVDGARSEIAAEYEEYRASPLRAIEAGQLAPMTSSFDFYVNATSEAQRVAYVEQAAGTKAIATVGAWGYLKTMIQILDKAVEDGVESLLVFDDDILFHKRTNEIFASAMTELPADWAALNLGTLQYHWDRRWIRWHSRHLYRNLGAAIGSHAVGLRKSIIPFLLERANRLELAYDVGPLSAAVRNFSDKSFFVYPNIAIQNIGDSDIGTSKFQEQSAIDKTCATYRWTMSDYHAPKAAPGAPIVSQAPQTAAPDQTEA